MLHLNHRRFPRRFAPRNDERGRLVDKLEFDEQLSYAPNLAMFSDRAYIDNNKERR
jgi:hypothetical protein